MIGAFLLMAATQVQTPDRTYEGNWYISDTTNNNTGEREVYAFQMYLKNGDPNFVTITMRCSDGKPAFFVEWDDVAFPDQAVLTIIPMDDLDPRSKEGRYVFEKSEDPIERGLRASPDTSAAIVSAIGNAKQATVTAHLSFGPRTVLMEIAGSQGAWSRVSRHCPIQTMSRPPL